MKFALRTLRSELREQKCWLRRVRSSNYLEDIRARKTAARHITDLELAIKVLASPRIVYEIGQVDADKEKP
jgi:hypothetical protein